MYTQNDLVIRVIIAVCITMLVLFLVFSILVKLKIENVKKESYNKGFDDGKKDKEVKK